MYTLLTYNLIQITIDLQHWSCAKLAQVEHSYFNMLTSRSNISQVKISRIAEVFRQANFKRIREFKKVILSVPFDSKSWPVFTWKFYLKFGGMVLQLCVLWMWDVTRWAIVPMSDLSLVIRSSSPPKSGRREEGPHYARTWSHRGRRFSLLEFSWNFYLRNSSRCNHQALALGIGFKKMAVVRNSTGNDVN